MRTRSPLTRTLAPLGAAAFALMTAVGIAGTAKAELCVAPPGPAPYLSGSPCWSAATAASTNATTCGNTCGITGAQSCRRTELNEPRWANSPRMWFDSNNGSETTQEGGYRIVVAPDQSQLSVSFQDLADTSKGDDAIYLGLEIEGLNKRIALRIPSKVGSGTYQYTSTDLSAISYYTYGTNNWGSANGWSNEIGGAPAWLKDVYSWQEQKVEAGGADWGIQFKIDLTHADIPVFSNKTRQVKMFLLHQKTLPSDGTATRNSAILSTPALPFSTDTAPPETLPNFWIPAAFSYWTVAQGLGGTAPCTGGVEIKDALDLGTRQGDGHEIVTNLGAINSFYANIVSPDETAPRTDACSTTPTACTCTLGTTGTQTCRSGVAAGTVGGWAPCSCAVQPSDLRARFRLANWGAQVDDPAAATWADIPNGSAVPNNAPDDFGQPNKNTFAFDCPPNDAGGVCGRFPVPAPENAHQCVQVSISNAQGKNHKITRASTYRNMRFVTLSTKTIPAEISIKGLQQRYNNVARDRNVIIQTVPRNMPAWDNLPRFLDNTLMNAVKLAAVGLGQMLGFNDLSLSGDDLMKTVWPTLEQHVYFDTGRTQVIKGVTHRMLRPMNSFGYYLSHSGVYYGFNYALAGTNTSLTKLTPNLYRVLVRNESSVKVNTGVSAEERMKFGTAANYLCTLWPWYSDCLR